MLNKTIFDEVMAEMLEQFPTLTDTEILSAQVAIRKYVAKMS